MGAGTSSGSRRRCGRNDSPPQVKRQVKQAKQAQAESLEEVNDLELRVLPNPTHDDFSVFVQSENKRDRITLQVFDQWGRQVEQRIVTGDYPADALAATLRAHFEGARA